MSIAPIIRSSLPGVVKKGQDGLLRLGGLISVTDRLHEAQDLVFEEGFEKGWGDIVLPWGVFGTHRGDGLIKLLFPQGSTRLSPAVGDFSVDFNCRMRSPSSLSKQNRLTAAYSFMKALAFPWLVVTVRPKLKWLRKYG